MPDHVQASNDCDAPVARIVSIDGTAEIKGAKQDPWRPAVLDEEICPAAALHVGMQSRAAVLLLASETVLRVDQNTTVFFPAPSSSGRSILDLIDGAIYFLTRTPRSLEVRTPFVNAGVEGTEFLISVEPAPGRAFVTVFEGTVAVTPPAGAPPESDPLLLRGPQTAVGVAGAAPRRLDPDRPEDVALWRFLVRPRDAVQWTLYYPPVLIGQDAPPDEPLPPALRDALAQLRRGAVAEAFAALERVPIAERTDRFHVVRAALLLAVGRAEAARRDLERAIALNPDNGNAFALLSVLAVKQLQTDEALELGRRAVAVSPESAAAGIALSYAQQANFDLGGAHETLRRAIEANPGDGLVWARLAEIELSLGYLDRALEAAERAHEIMPDLSLANVILGYARLAQVDIAAAKQAFEAAIARESANPTAWLGLGLARIREGELADGRQHIEIAVALTPNDSLLRSYLGKAYFEEKRDALASAEFDRAKRLDPQDPTPYLYDAIRKQTQNRPVEALRDIQKSIELNDNRAVYRSRLLLDEDLGARGARLGSIYRDLGFEQLALVEGWKSINFDPGSHSGHRLLADTYSVLPRHEIARDSELLQSQLLQPININPVQPRLAANGLAYLNDTGPADVTFNEFTRLFARDQLRLQADGILGSQDTVANNIIVSGIYRDFSFSAGQSHFETDGIRENNDLNQNIYNAFVQANISHRTSAQVEFRAIDEDAGDLDLLFDPGNFSSSQTEESELKSVRVGLRHSFSPNSTALVSYVYREVEGELDTGTGFRAVAEEDANFLEVRHLYDSSRFNTSIGAGYFDGENVTDLFVGPFPPIEQQFEIRHDNVYAYLDVNYPNDVIFTLGVSADFFDTEGLQRNQVNPKVGVTWNLFDDTTFRAAAFKGLKRTVSTSQTIEPTQVAGFNQFFDGINGEKFWRYGAAIDQKIGKDLFIGAEYSERDLKIPLTSIGPVPTSQDFDGEEQIVRTYLYWTPWDRLALSAEYQFENIERNPQVSPVGLGESKTHRVPVELRYFDRSGFFARARATYVDQKGRFQDTVGVLQPGSDSFWTADASIGFRFPKRVGLVSLEVQNVFDQHFNFQDIDPRNSTLRPERVITGRLTLSF